MVSIIVSASEIVGDFVEVVERKGLGHPDTICDALTETLSRNLCAAYRDRFGMIPHYNVDKALLCGGSAVPAFGGGSVISPINIYLAGRATTEVEGQHIKIEDIAIEGSRSWMDSHLHALDTERDVCFHVLVRPGSHDLQDLFSRRTGQKAPLANDTSIGVGYAPMTPLERLVLAIEQSINGRQRQQDHPAWGEDVKVMGIRHGNAVHLTIACAMIGRYLANMDEYLVEKSAIERLANELALVNGFSTCEVKVNAADDPAGGAVYLTVTGTSAEAGDDGEVGRGNRVNGLITPCRPMSLEAAAGKNPVSHVGKLYNVASRNIAETLTATMPEIAAAQCLMVSRIGMPVTDPAIVQIKVATHGDIPVDRLERRIKDITADGLRKIPELIDDFMAGAIGVF